MQKNLSGILEYSDEGNYILENYNISDLLSKFYIDSTPCKIEIYNLGKKIFDESGIINKFKNLQLKNVYDYHINCENLESVLFENVGKFINITIIDLKNERN